MSRTCVSFRCETSFAKSWKDSTFRNDCKLLSLALHRVTPFVKPVSQCFETFSLRTGVYRNTLNKQPIRWKNNIQGHQIQYSRSQGRSCSMEFLNCLHPWFDEWLVSRWQYVCATKTKTVLKRFKFSPVVKNCKVTAILSSGIMLSRIIVFCFWIQCDTWSTTKQKCCEFILKRNSLLQDDDNTQILSFFRSMVLPKYPSSFFLANSAELHRLLSQAVSKVPEHAFFGSEF